MAKSSKPRKRKLARPKFRRLNEEELLFRSQAKQYFRVLDLTMDVSQNQHSIDTDGRGVRAVKIFTRQTLSAMSLSSILPNLSADKDPDVALWDVSSIASITRNILETYLAIFYSGIENISDEEAELRFFIGQLHRNREWYLVHKSNISGIETLNKFEEGMKEQKERIKAHSYLINLTHAQKNKALKGDEIYYTKVDFEEKVSICSELRAEYQLLSNFVHPLPLSIERIDNDRGRGTSNIYDISYSLGCIEIATKYLAASTLGIIDHFPDQLGKIFDNKTKPIRELLLTNEFNKSSQGTQ
ncbi:DUF5677 domain-containing protein [Shewanella sp. MF05960]|uniref:DUF5677 domain-containing protein n=1 Tax=Shewanella sp. MF05960 TaxID=3434874 RepID=UPI003D799B91